MQSDKLVMKGRLRFMRADLFTDMCQADKVISHDSRPWKVPYCYLMGSMRDLRLLRSISGTECH